MSVARFIVTHTAGKVKYASRYFEAIIDSVLHFWKNAFEPKFTIKNKINKLRSGKREIAISHWVQPAEYEKDD